VKRLEQSGRSRLASGRDAEQMQGARHERRAFPTPIRLDGRVITYRRAVRRSRTPVAGLPSHTDSRTVSNNGILAKRDLLISEGTASKLPTTF
jgi:hypothetical protein